MLENNEAFEVVVGGEGKGGQRFVSPSGTRRNLVVLNLPPKIMERTECVDRERVVLVKRHYSQSISPHARSPTSHKSLLFGDLLNNYGLVSDRVDENNRVSFHTGQL